VAALRLAEREGVGIDRMVRDMLALGHAEPAIAEIPGPYVRVTLAGGDPDTLLFAFLASLAPPTAAPDVDTLLLLHHLMRRGWVDVRRAAPVLQRSHLAKQRRRSRA
jgi:ATP-dependent DNA helicase RecG